MDGFIIADDNQNIDLSILDRWQCSSWQGREYGIPARGLGFLTSPEPGGQMRVS